MRQRKKVKAIWKREPRSRRAVGNNGELFRSVTEKLIGDPLIRRYGAQYESKRFDISVPLTYLPDFFIPEIELHIEVKGTLDMESRRKILAFLDQHNPNFLVLLQRMGARMRDRKGTNESWLDNYEIPYLWLEDSKRHTKLAKIHDFIDTLFTHKMNYGSIDIDTIHRLANEHKKGYD